MGKSKKKLKKQKRKEKNLKKRVLKGELKGQKPAYKNTQVVDPADLVIFETSEGLELRIDDRPILLDRGIPLRHTRLQLLEHIREEFDGFGLIELDEEGVVMKPNMISSYALLEVQRRMENDSDNPFMSGFRKWLICDPCLSRCAGPECVDQMARWKPLDRFYEAEGLIAPDFAQIPVDDECTDVDSILRDRAGHLFLPDDPQKEEFICEATIFVEGVDAFFRKLGPEEWAAMWMLHSYHCNVLLFPLLLVSGRCSAQEYANGLMAAHCLLTTAFGDVDVNAHAQQVREFREDAQVVLNFITNARSPWAREILMGENDKREFKATLRFDLKTQQHNKELEHSVLKSIAGFLNGDGGALFVGVANNGAIEGVELDGFDNDDKWSLHLVNRIGQQIGNRFLTMCKIEFDVIHGKSVARISIRPSYEPAYFDERPLKINGAKKDAFFVRVGPSTRKFCAEETPKYCATRFPSHRTFQTSLYEGSVNQKINKNMKIKITVDASLADNSAKMHRNTWKKIKEASSTPDCWPDEASIVVGPTFQPLYALNIVESLEEDVLAVSQGVKDKVYSNTESLEV